VDRKKFDDIKKLFKKVQGKKVKTEDEAKLLVALESVAAWGWSLRADDNTSCVSCVIGVGSIQGTIRDESGDLLCGFFCKEQQCRRKAEKEGWDLRR